MVTMAKIALSILLVVSCATIIRAEGFPELCPCLPIKLCPRIYGASPEDRKYLGEFLKCPKDDEVRCCGVSVISSDSPADKSSAEEVVNHLVHNEIEDVRMEHLTIPPPIITTTEEIPTTTEFIEEPTTTELPIETTTIDEELITTTELPPEEVTYPRFGKGVEFIYAMDENKMEQESQRQAKKLSFDKEDNVFVIMPSQFLEEDFKADVDTTLVPISTTSTTTESPDVQGSSDGVTESEISETTILPTTSTVRPRIKKRIRVKVRKGFHLLPRLHPNDLLQEDAETTTQENTRINRNVEEPKRKINHSLYARKKHVLEMKNNIIPIGLATTEASPVEASDPTTTTTTTELTTAASTTTESPSSSHQNPAILMLLNSNVAKRKNYFNRRLHVEPKTTPTSTTLAAGSSPASSRKIDSDYQSQLEGQHQKMIEQVARAIQQDSMMNTFDVADELMDPEVAVRIGKIQTMLAEEIMQRIFARIGLRANLSSEPVEEPVTQQPKTTTSTTTESIALEEEKEVATVEQGNRPYRGSKRYIDTNFLNAYENVIHKVEEKIKSHKNHPHPRGRPTREPVTGSQTLAASTTTTSSVPTSSTTTTTVRPTTGSSGNIQILLNKRRRNKSRISKLKTTTTTEAPITTTESAPETITEIIKELEKIQEQEEETRSMVREFKPSPLWQIYPDRASSDDAEELAEPIDLLGRSARQLTTTNERTAEEGFVPIPNSQMSKGSHQVNIESVAESLLLPEVNRLIRFV